MTGKSRLHSAIPTALLLCFGLLASAVAASTFAAQEQKPEEKYAALLGTWDVHTVEVSYSFTFEFFLKDGRLQGTYTGSAGATEMKNLTFEDNIVRFSVSVNGMDLDYQAVITGDKLSGEVNLQYGEAEIAGQKRK